MPTWRDRRVTLLRELTRAAGAAYVDAQDGPLCTTTSGADFQVPFDASHQPLAMKIGRDVSRQR